MSAEESLPILIGALQGLASTTVFVLVLFIGFCVIFGFTKLKKTAGQSPVVKSLDEVVTRNPMEYLPASAPRGPIDQLHGSQRIG
jgi:hypothetical protein